MQDRSDASADLPLLSARAFAGTRTPVHGAALTEAPQFSHPSCRDLMLRVLQRTREPEPARVGAAHARSDGVRAAFTTIFWRPLHYTA